MKGDCWREWVVLGGGEQRGEIWTTVIAKLIKYIKKHLMAQDCRVKRSTGESLVLHTVFSHGSICVFIRGQGLSGHEAKQILFPISWC